jgi:hypothetical protein
VKITIEDRKGSKRTREVEFTLEEKKEEPTVTVKRYCRYEEIPV